MAPGIRPLGAKYLHRSLDLLPYCRRALASGMAESEGSIRLELALPLDEVRHRGVATNEGYLQ